MGILCLHYGLHGNGPNNVDSAASTSTYFMASDCHTIRLFMAANSGNYVHHWIYRLSADTKSRLLITDSKSKSKFINERLTLNVSLKTEEDI
jgi:hypothetical protein